jgi:hypothetical protein
MGNRSSAASTSSATQDACWPQATGRATCIHRHRLHPADGFAMGAVAQGNGVRFGDDLLVPSARLAKGRRVGKAASCPAGEAAQRQPTRFFARDCRQLISARCAWGKKTEPNPTDRRKAGSKHHLIVDGNGTPLNVILTGANRHDSTQLMPLLDGMPAIAGRRGRPLRKPGCVQADRA